MNRTVYKTLGIIGGVLILVYIFAQLFRGTVSSLKTEIAVKTTAYDTVSAKGFIIRDEKIINSSGSGILEYEAANGSKISKGGVIAAYYPDEESVKNKKQLSALRDKMASLTELNAQNNIYVPDIDMLSTQITQSMAGILSGVDTGNISQIEKHQTALLTYLNQNKLATKQIDSFDKEIADCKTEWNQLKKKTGDSTKQVVSNMSGYFVNQSDGYESSVPFDKVLSLTPKQIEKLKPAEVPKDSIGKIVSEHEWYVAASMKTADMKNIKEDTDLVLRLSLSSVDELPVRVEKINEDKETGKSVVIFSCSYMNEELSALRSADIEIVVKKYTGLEISNSAIRLVDGQRGVYVHVADMARFRKINVLYSNDQNSICELTEKQGYLMMYDDVIVEGKDIYDKKFVN